MQLVTNTKCLTAPEPGKPCNRPYYNISVTARVLFADRNTLYLWFPEVIRAMFLEDGTNGYLRL